MVPVFIFHTTSLKKPCFDPKSLLQIVLPAYSHWNMGRILAMMFRQSCCTSTVCVFVCMCLPSPPMPTGLCPRMLLLVTVKQSTEEASLSRWKATVKTWRQEASIKVKDWKKASQRQINWTLTLKNFFCQDCVRVVWSDLIYSGVSLATSANNPTTVFRFRSL